MKIYINKHSLEFRIVPSSIQKLNLDYYLEQQLSFYNYYDVNLLDTNTIFIDKNDEIEFTYKEIKQIPYLFNDKIEIFIFINKIYRKIKRLLIKTEDEESIIKQLNEIEKILRFIKIKQKINIEKDLNQLLILKDYVYKQKIIKYEIEFYKFGRKETPIMLIKDVLAHLINKNTFILADWKRDFKDILITGDKYQFLFNEKFQKFINQNFEEKKEKILKKIKKRKNKLKLTNNEKVILIFNNNLINAQQELLKY